MHMQKYIPMEKHWEYIELQMQKWASPLRNKISTDCSHSSQCIYSTISLVLFVCFVLKEKQVLSNASKYIFFMLIGMYYHWEHGDNQ